MAKKICIDVRGLLIRNTPADISLLIGGSNFVQQVQSLPQVKAVCFCFWGGAGFRRLAKDWLNEFKPELFVCQQSQQIFFCANPNETARCCQGLKVDVVVTSNPKIKKALKGSGPPNQQPFCLHVKGVKNKPDFETIFQNLVKVLEELN